MTLFEIIFYIRDHHALPLEIALDDAAMFRAWSESESSFCVGWFIELLGTKRQQESWGRAIDFSTANHTMFPFYGERWLADQGRKIFGMSPSAEAVNKALAVQAAYSVGP